VTLNTNIENPRQWRLICEKGFEDVLAQELLSFMAYDLVIQKGLVSFNGDLEVALRCCLWSRVAIRLLKPLSNFAVSDTDALYEQAKKIPWSDFFNCEQSFAVDVATKQSMLSNSHFAALRIKDAIVDYFQETQGQRPHVELQQPDIKIFLYLENDGAELSLDFSGESLHKRSYRKQSVEAPIKEHLAAGILLRMGWNRGLFLDNPDASKIFLDPFCGGGTFLIEAAMIASDTAPGLYRSYYGFIASKLFDQTLWASLLAEARQRSGAGLQQLRNVKIIGYDADKQSLSAATINIQSAQFEKFIHIERKEVAQLTAPLAASSSLADDKPPHLFLASNPPYGHRLGEVKSVRYLYRFLGEKMRESFAGWTVAVVSDQIEHLDNLRFNTHQTIKTLHGGSSLFVRIIDVPQSGSVVRPEVCHSQVQIKKDLVLSAECSLDLANRLKKNFKHVHKSFSGTLPYCFRLYDADLPEYNMAMDFYGDHLRIQEYAAPASIDVEKAKQRLYSAVRTTRELFGVDYDKTHIKIRSKQKGKSQYTKNESETKLLEVYEGSCRFLVNLRDYIDTGLFSDHRLVRKLIEDNAKGKHFLNLFCYTATASVHAAMGGAKSTTSVDLSQTYLDWSRCNFSLNGFSEVNNHLVRADVMTWLMKNSYQYELIFIDPPTFSNSKKMREHFDVQAQHVELLRLALKHLAADGEILFSNNFKKFKLDEDALADLRIEEITVSTTSPDFARTGQLHRCWRIRPPVKQTSPWPVSK